MGWPITQLSTIYGVQCQKTGRVYIGATCRLDQRIKEHFRELRAGNKTSFNSIKREVSPWQRDYNKWGEDSFAVFIIEENVPPSKRQEREAFWIHEYMSADPKYGYNTRDEHMDPIDPPIIHGVPEMKFKKQAHREKWTGELVGKMHNARVTLEDLAVEMGVTKGYISMILNGLRSPAGAREKLCAAFEAICERRKEDSA